MWNKNSRKSHDAAYTLQKIIMKTKRKPFSQNLKIEYIATDITKILDPLLQFFTHLICGYDKQRGVTE